MVRPLKGIAVVRASGIRSLGHGDAKVERRAAGKRKLRHHPTIRRFVVLRDGVAVIVSGAGSYAKHLPQGVSRCGTEEHPARTLVKDSKRHVHSLDELRCT